MLLLVRIHVHAHSHEYMLKTFLFSNFEVHDIVHDVPVKRNMFSIFRIFNIDNFTRYRKLVHFCLFCAVLIVIFMQPSSLPGRKLRPSKLENKLNSNPILQLAVHVHNESNVCSKGSFTLDKHWLLQELNPFLEVYLERPYRHHNFGGTNLMHQFGLWCLLRRLKPKYVIESGIFRGLGTWILRQACPSARLIMLDPAAKELSYTDQHPDTLYFTGDKFRDFNRLSLNCFPFAPFFPWLLESSPCRVSFGTLVMFHSVYVTSPPKALF